MFKDVFHTSIYFVNLKEKLNIIKNIKDITLSIFAIIGFISIITAFNTQTQQETHGTPESHVWEFHMPQEVLLNASSSAPSFAINKVTGEVRKYNGSDLDIKKDGTIENIQDIRYAIMTPAE